MCLLEAERLEAAPGWIWLVGNPMGKGSDSYSHKPVEPVDSVDQFCQPTPLYLLLFSLGIEIGPLGPLSPLELKEPVDFGLWAAATAPWIQ